MSTRVADRETVAGVVVCAADDLAPGTMRRAVVGERKVVVVRTAEGELFGLHDKCLHQGAPISRGRLHTATGGDTSGDYREVDGQTVIKCPWHGYEYDVRTGCAMFDPRRRLRKVAVSEVDGQVVVSA